MGFTDLITETIGRKLFPRTVEYYESMARRAEQKADYAQESLTTIQLEIENIGYQRLFQSGLMEYRYTRRHLNSIIELAVHMALKNPITARTVNVQADYVFGQGVSFIAKHPWVQQVIDEFVGYRENQKVLTSHPAMLNQERRQMVYGSIFFALNTNAKTGRVIVRNIHTPEVDDIIRDPEDSDKEWYIKHTFTDDRQVERTVYHPVYGIDEYSGIPAPWNMHLGSALPQGEIAWNVPVIHVAFNRFGKEKFAIPELYPQLDWATAYKRFLEDWTSIIRAFARMALKVTGLAGKQQAAAAKSMMSTSISLNNVMEKNPSNVAGSIPLLGKGVDVSAVKTAGATTPAGDGDAILNMAGCGVGLPNTFFGDAGKGNFATAKTLDRPTELKMTSRQRLWMVIFSQILKHVVDSSCIAPDGILHALGGGFEEQIDPFTGQVVIVPIMPINDNAQYGEVGKPIDCGFEVYFPEILERNVTDRVRALANATTMFGKPLTDIIPDKRMVAKLMMQALNIPNAESYIPLFVEMWTKNMNAEPGEPVEAIIIPPPADSGGAEDAAQGGDVGENG